MNLLALPGLVKLSVLAAAVAALAGLYAWRVWAERDYGRAEIRAEWTAAALAESEANARETLRRLNRQQEIDRVHEVKLSAARADAAATADAAAKLRQRITQLANREPPIDSASAAVSAPAGRIGDVAGQCVAAYSELAEAARRGFLAGNDCTGRYDALIPP